MEPGRLGHHLAIGPNIGAPQADFAIFSPHFVHSLDERPFSPEFCGLARLKHRRRRLGGNVTLEHFPSICATSMISKR